MPPRELERPPEFDAADPVQAWIFIRWTAALQELYSEEALGPRPAAIGAAIAAHKLAWLKWMLRDWRAMRGGPPNA